MQRSTYLHKILDTIQPTGGDIVVKNRYLYINGVLMFKMDDVERDGITKAVSVGSVTAGVLTYGVPVVPLNATTYNIQVTVDNPTAQGVQQNPLVFNIPVTTPANGTLANADLVTLFKNKINAVAQTYNTYFVASGTTSLVLTATTAYPVITGSATSPMTVVQTTTGVPTSGLVANMLALGVQTNSTPAQLGVGNPSNTQWISGTPGTLAGTSYTAYTILSALNVGESNTQRINQENNQILWVDEQSANYAVFIADLDQVLGGFLKAGTIVNTHELEVKVAPSGAQPQ